MQQQIMELLAVIIAKNEVNDTELEIQVSGIAVRVCHFNNGICIEIKRAYFDSENAFKEDFKKLTEYVIGVQE